MSLEKAESIAKIISLIALPLVVAVGGWYIQSSMNSNAVKSQYVSIAVGVLSQAPDKSNLAIRDWASKTLAQHSSVTFTDSQLEALVTGKVVIPEYRDFLVSERRVAQHDVARFSGLVESLGDNEGINRALAIHERKLEKIEKLLENH